MIRARLVAAALTLSFAIAACGREGTQAVAPQIAMPDAGYSVEEKTVATLQDDMRAGRVSSEQLVGLYLQRIRDVDQNGPALHAVLAVNPKAAEDAKRLDAERTAGKLRGPLHGIPVLLKDNIESADPLPTTGGSLALKDNVTGRDAPIVARLREAGAVILGKANLSEWANFRSTRSTSGWSAVGGLTRNPYALDRNACGSSAGSGAAIAANLAVLAVGTETDGSITMPAAYNGVVGLKPTVGLLSRHRIIPITAAQDTAGPMTRTVADAAAMLTVMAGSDPNDAATREADARKRDYVAALSPQALQGKRLAVARFLMGYSPSLDAAFEKALDELRAAGVELVDIDKFDGLDEMGGDETAIMLSDFKVEIDAYLATTPVAVSTRTLNALIDFNRANAATEMPYFGQELFEQAARGNTDRATVDRLRARNRRRAGEDGIDRLLREYKANAIIAPSTHPAHTTDLLNGDHFTGGATQLSAVSGYPHLTVPMGYVQGLPVGISFLGPEWSEELLLSMGYAFEQRVAARKPPTYPATIDTRTVNER